MEGSSSAKQNLLTINQFIFIIFGSIVEITILSLPNGLVKISQQDGWISALIGGIYPLYVVMIAGYISKKFPNDTILVLSKRYFGKFLGGILNFIFASYFIFYVTMVASYYNNLVRSFIMGFLTPFKILAILFGFILYAAAKGIKVIGRISELCFYLTCLLILSPVLALRFPGVTNICPVFGSGFYSIVEASKNSIFAYSGAEIILLIYPFVREKKKIFSSAVISVVLVIVMYVWCVFITTYYLGPDIVNKSYWSFLLVTESITITIINNYRYIFILLWSLITFKSCAIYCYGIIYVLKDFIKNKKTTKFYFIMYPLLVYLALKYGNEVRRESISNYIAPCYILFNVVYITVIAAFVCFKGGTSN